MATDSIKYEIYDDNGGMDDTTTSVGGTVESTPQNTLKTVNSAESVDPDKISKKVEDYVKQVRPKMWILTPCYGGVCHVTYVQALMATLALFDKLGVRYHVEFCKNDSLITRARNNLIAKAMTDPDMTHMVFIDNDITWKPVDLVRMMISGKELVGGIYPIKHYEWEKLVKDPLNPYNSNVVRQWLDCKSKSNIGGFFNEEEFIQANLLRYNVNYLTANLQISDNLTQVRHIPTGFMMIQRSVIVKMQRVMEDKKYVDDVSYLTEEENKNAYALFDCVVLEGHYLSEDWYFCEKWRQLGGEIWADVSVNLTHTGTEEFKGSYISSLITM